MVERTVLGKALNLLPIDHLPRGHQRRLSVPPPRIYPAMGLFAPSERARKRLLRQKLAACIPAYLPKMIKALRIE